MSGATFATTPILMDDLGHAKTAVTIVLLALFWGWETWFPFVERGTGRLRHAGHNLAVAVVNTILLGLVFGSVTVLVADQAASQGWGVLPALGVGGLPGTALALVLLDGWTYLWHRANHSIPFLWRFHRMHHSDNRMDVTTATRFHLGEHVGSSVLRLGFIPLVGFQVEHLILYDMLLVAVTLFHHANLSLGRWDRWLCLLMVTPYMHKVHHSRQRPETNSNYATVLSVWDRLGGTYRERADPAAIDFGLDEFDEPTWQTFTGMFRTPFVARNRPREPAPGPESKTVDAGAAF